MGAGQFRPVVLSLLVGFHILFFLFPSIWNMCGVDAYILYPGQISSLMRYHEAFPLVYRPVARAFSPSHFSPQRYHPVYLMI